MPNETLDQLIAQVEATIEVEKAAIAVIEGIGDRVAAAVQKVLDNTAITKAELAPITDELESLKASTAALSAAVVANTPAPAPVDPAPTTDPAPTE